MSWDEAKMLSDVVTSNAVPSGVLLRRISSNGNENSISMTGTGFANVASVFKRGSAYSSSITITADGQSVNISIDRSEDISAGNSLLVPFEREITVKTAGFSSASIAFIFFNRKSIGGGYRIVRLRPCRKAVA